MMSFVREKKWTRVGLSVVRRWPDNASAVSEKWREQKMSGNLSPEIGTSPRLNYVVKRLLKLVGLFQ
jgi:hypothetical protein